MAYLFYTHYINITPVLSKIAEKRPFLFQNPDKRGSFGNVKKSLDFLHAKLYNIYIL